MNIRVHFRDKGWIWQITGLCVVLGMLLGAALKTQQTIRVKSGITTTRFSGLVQSVLDQKEVNKTLQSEIVNLRAEVAKYQRMLAEGSNSSTVLNDELRRAKFQAGLSPAMGEGVEVVLKDSNKKAPADDPFTDFFIIHDLDLRNVVNELLANGAEAIAIADKDSTQRVTARTGIRCVAGVIRVNEVPMAPPYSVLAIGPPNVLRGGLEMRGGLIDQFRTGMDTGQMITVKTRNDIQLPAYSGNTSFLYAHEAKQKNGGKP